MIKQDRMSKTIVVASNNPVKIRAVQEGFERMFPEQRFALQGVAAPSQVSDQPFSDEETLRGAHNRARGASKLAPLADYWVGIEGGIEEHGQEMAAYAWIVILGQNLTGKSRTGIFYLPPRVAELIRQGKELGEADDIVFGRSNSKQENGAIGLLTGDVIDRVQLYEHAVVLALVPFKNPELY
jgi:inosine/xanthosine triphosphatase